MEEVKETPVVNEQENKPKKVVKVTKVYKIKKVKDEQTRTHRQWIRLGAWPKDQVRGLLLLVLGAKNS